MHELILVVEDNRMAADLTRAVLLGAGYLVMEAKTAEDGLALLADDTRLPDLIVLDLNLPKMPGLEFAKKVRSVGCLIPIIVYTAYAKREWGFPQTAYDAGANGFCEKSADIDLLPRVIEQYLQAAARAKALLPHTWDPPRKGYP